MEWILKKKMEKVELDKIEWQSSLLRHRGAKNQEAYSLVKLLLSQRWIFSSKICLGKKDQEKLVKALEVKKCKF